MIRYAHGWDRPTGHVPTTLTRQETGKKWFDCADCHHEQESHQLRQALEMTSLRRPTSTAHTATTTSSIDAVIPKPALRVEGEDARMDNRMLKDDRVKNTEQRTIFDIQSEADKLG
ncbi:hypothetical protein ONZ43_g424 [Nemania bipapillata]|uniref:Uncharacterized protein n=1 Tax=Nemania bipapillata TaxID=110536 RepID=A0ACC2J844_9PEZI|nr:hypothetical protein ONZ43_g424 [Nemania bipapillata]